MYKEKIIDFFYAHTQETIVCKEKEINFVDIPLLIIHQTGLYLFIEGNLTDTWFRKDLLDNVYQLQLFFNTSRLNFHIYSIDKDLAYYLNPFTDDFTAILLNDGFKNLEEHILNNIQAGSYIIDENKMYYYKEKLSNLFNKDQKIKTDEEGNIYVRKGNHWFPASTDDVDEVFNTTLFGGIFGLHKFKRGENLSGLGYLLTFGFFCIGWIFDLLALIFGVARDPEGLYYLPLTDTKKKAIIVLCCIPLSFLVVFLYTRLLTFISSGIGELLSSLFSNVM